tara:strand:+ start:2431 stop:2535 length:105 start_codon:yes stop_codon:yes gene_type:complete
MSDVGAKPGKEGCRVTESQPPLSLLTFKTNKYGI